MVLGIKEKIFTLSGSIIIGAAIFFLCSYLLKSQEAYAFIKIIREKTGRDKKT
jgi:hypothetical protein